MAIRTFFFSARQGTLRGGVRRLQRTIPSRQGIESTSSQDCLQYLLQEVIWTTAGGWNFCKYPSFCGLGNQLLLPSPLIRSAPQEGMPPKPVSASSGLPETRTLLSHF
ncbi:hypothetical protein TNCV_2926091 [Trichonephila clavipes]|nr:hypothetical protein TNCV_2926091 [Trichonephila clavipes]